VTSHRWDKENWIRTLAGATLNNGEWQAQDPELVRKGALGVIQEIITELYDDARHAAAEFNQFCDPRRQVRVLALDARSEGFILMQARTQLRVVWTGGTLQAHVTVSTGFTHRQIHSRTWSPKLDGLGGVWWQTEAVGSQLLAGSMIIKQLFEDLNRATLMFAT
jgi:hypothetical protein